MSEKADPLTRMSDPVILNVKRSGLGLDVSVQKRKMTGLSVDYQRSANAATVGPVLQVIEGAMTNPSPRGVLPLLVEGIASLDRKEKKLSKHPTVMNVKSSSIKMGITLRRNRVTGLSIDYQRISNGNDIKELIGVLNRICSAEVIPEAEETGVGYTMVDEGQKKGTVVPDERYWDIIVQAAQESLTMLGEQGKQAVLTLLERRYGLGVEGIPKHHRAFIDLLRQVVGDGAAEAVEKEMVNEIKNKVPASGETLKEVIQTLGVEPEAEAPPGGVEGAPEEGEIDQPPEENSLELPTVSLSFRVPDRESERSK